MNLRVLIADDEELCRQRLRQMLLEEPAIEIVAECADGREALAAIQKQAPHVVFLDIKMPELDGFGVAESLDGAAPPAIVFVSAFDAFASQAFVYNAVDYLLKPFDRERFRRALSRARNRVAPQTSNDPEAPQPDSIQVIGENAARRLIVKSGHRLILVNIEEIDWVSAADNYIELHVGKQTHLLRMSMMTMQKQFPENQFVRVSRSALVNHDRVRQIHSKSHGDATIILASGATLIATRTYRKEWKMLLKGSSYE